MIYKTKWSIALMLLGCILLGSCESELQKADVITDSLSIESEEQDYDYKSMSLLANSNNIEDQVTSIAREVYPPTLDLTDDQLKVLNGLKNARVVGLGEATHNTKEFFEMKHRVFQYLVENHGYRVFAIEADFGESYYIDKYITTGEGDLDYLMEQVMIFWVWRTEEVKAFIEWMREFNEGRPIEDMIRYIGFDAQLVNRSFPLLQSFLSEVFSADEISSVQEHLDNVDIMLDFNWVDLSVGTKFKIRQSILKLQEFYNDKEVQIKEVKSDYDFLFFQQLLIQLEQVWKVRNAIFGSNQRDRAMADNVHWIQKLLGEDVKIGVWAHNGHVRDSNQTTFITMGHHLNNELAAEEYQVLLFYFTEGSFNARDFSDNYILKEFDIDFDPVPNSINDVLSKVGMESFIFRTDGFRIRKTRDLGSWLTSNHIAMSIGAVFDSNTTNQNIGNWYREYNMRENADYIWYIHETTAAVALGGNFNLSKPSINGSFVSPNSSLLK